MFITAFKILIFCHFTDDGSCKGAETFESKKLLTSVRDKIINLLDCLYLHNYFFLTCFSLEVYCYSSV